MGKYITKTAEKIKPEGLSKTREVHPGDLILSNSMSFGRPYIMAINGCIHDGWLLLRNDKNLYDLQFLCHLLGSENMLHQYKSFAAGSTVNNLNKDLVGNTTVSFPKKTEQSKLGAFLDSLDNLITLHQRKLDKLSNVKKALLEKMFPKNDSDVPEIRFKGFTDAWEQRKLDDFCKISIGEFVIKTKQRDDAPYPVYNGGTSYTGFYDDFNQTGKKVIISARGANAGYVNKSEKPYWAGNSCYSIDVKDETNWIFLYHKIKHIQTSFIKGQQSANIPSVSKEQVQKTEIMCPQVTEQNKIAIFLEDMDNLITLHQRERLS